MSTPQSAIVDATRLQEFMGKMVVEMSAAMSGALVLIGDKLGFYRSLAEERLATPQELAPRTETTVNRSACSSRCLDGGMSGIGLRGRPARAEVNQLSTRDDKATSSDLQWM